MSVSKRIDSSWTDVTIKASREEAYAPIAPQMIAFNGHKEEILSKLREGRGRSARSKPFDEERAWRDISRFAEMHFWSAIGEQATTSPAERFKQLRRVGRTLDRAHTRESDDAGGYWLRSVSGVVRRHQDTHGLGDVYF